MFSLFVCFGDITVGNLMVQKTGGKDELLETTREEKGWSGMGLASFLTEGRVGNTLSLAGCMTSVTTPQSCPCSLKVFIEESKQMHVAVFQ